MLWRYSCGGCGLGLAVLQRLIDPAKVKSWFNSICPSCAANLANNVVCLRVESDGLQPLESMSPDGALPFEPKLPVNFRRTIEFQSEAYISFGDEALDKILGRLHLGCVAFLYGSRQCLAASELLCVRAQLDPNCGGLNSEAIFIDGGNRFDPYLVAEYAEQLSLDRDQALDRIFISRAFTYHQMTSIINRILPEAIHERKVKLVVVSDIITLYHDPEVHHSQNLKLFKTTLNLLTTTAKTERTIALVTSFSVKRSDSNRFLDAIRQRADIVLRFEERRHSARLILEKHPTRSGESHIAKQPAPMVLEDYLEATVNG